jgi:predicted CopG family antitoxin
MSETKLKHIVVDVRNYERLQKLGHTAQSFNDVITRILNERESNQQAAVIEVYEKR